jgi:hypothetical protein
MVDHDLDRRRPQRLADRGRERRSRLRIGQLPVEFVRVRISSGQAGCLARRIDGRELFRRREVDQVGRKRRDVNDAAIIPDGVDLLVG